MKRKIIPIIVILLISVPVMGFAIETLNTVYVNGSAPMNIDGDLVDWEGINLQEVPIAGKLSPERNHRSLVYPQGPNDLSVSFKCFADAQYVYIAVSVIDDELLIGNYGFSKGWKNDAVTIFFDGDLKDISKQYYDANDGMIKVVFDPPDGVAYIEGLIPYSFEVMVPYFWESRGVKAGFKQNETGYTVEIAIPFNVLGWDTLEPGKQMGVNFRIHDMDSDMDIETQDCGFVWAPDPRNMNVFTTEEYGRIIFTEAVSMPGVTSVEPGGTVRVVGSEARELELELSTPDYSDGNALLTAVLMDMADKKWDTAVSKLSPVQEIIWTNPLLGMIHLESGKYDEGVERLTYLAETCPDAFASKWAREYPKYKAMVLLDTVEGVKKNYANGPARSAYILHEYLKQYPDDQEALDRFYETLKRTGGDEYDLMIINKIINESVNQDIISKAKNALARYYYFNSDYNQAAQVAEAVINSNADSKTTLDAQMILLSIEQKTSR